MKKKAFISVLVAFILAFTGIFALTSCSDNEPWLLNDPDEGTVTFGNIDKEVDCDIDLLEGDNKIDVTVEKGQLHIVVTATVTDDEGNETKDTIYEGDFKKSDSFTVNASSGENYVFTVSGKKATGTIQYPVEEVEEVTE